MPEYDAEADDYDRTRGGLPRAQAAAQALSGLLATRSLVVDVAVGTGTVAAELGTMGHRVIGVDLSHGMLRHAARRLPGRVVQADARALPVRSASVDAVTAVWLLHLLDDAEPVLEEAARVLRPGGVLVTTVDKSAAARLASGAAPKLGWAADSCAVLTRQGACHGLHPCAATSFVGHGQAHPGGSNPLYLVLAFRRN